MLDEAFTHDQALRQLLLIADFFQTTEPYNPISYLLRRAISWGNMTLEDWLGEVVQDEIALKSIQKTLGINQNGLDK